jgi:hypothetical protein
LSKKYILPLLNQLDKEGITVKQGDVRILAVQKNDHEQENSIRNV